MLYCKLNNRSLISFVGKDIVPFLQGIITNDINKVKNNRAIYASLLSPQGKILKDFFLFKVGPKIYLDTTKEYLETLEEKLNIYKINQEIKFSKENFFSYYIFYGKSINKVFNLLQKEGFFEIKNKVIIFNDPRKLILGCRIICLNENDNNKIKKINKSKNLVIGFGITIKTISSLKKADGLVVGSALCKEITESIKKRHNPVKKLSIMVKRLRAKLS